MQSYKKGSITQKRQNSDDKNNMLVPNDIVQNMSKKSLELTIMRKTKNCNPLISKKAFNDYECSHFEIHKLGTGISCLETISRTHKACDNGYKKILSGGDDGQVVCFDIAHGTSSICHHGVNKICSVQFFHDDNSILSSSVDGTTKLWTTNHPESYVLSATYQHNDEVVSSHIHPVRDYIITVCKNNNWSLWDTTKSELIMTRREKNKNQYKCASLHPDGLLLGVGTEDSMVKLFDYQTGGKLVASFPQHGSDEKRANVSGIAFNENGYLMASSSEYGVKLWDLRKLNCVKHFTTNEQVNSIKFDLSGNYLAVGSKSLGLYSVKDYSVLRDFYPTKPSSNKPINSVCVGNDALYLAIGMDDNILRLYGPTNLKTLHSCAPM